MGNGAAGIGPLTDQVWGQNYPVPRVYAFAPGNAVGPVPTGFGAAPLATLPPGSGNYGSSAGSPVASVVGGGSGASLAGIPLKGVLILVGLAVVGIAGLYYVHWRP